MRIGLIGLGAIGGALVAAAARTPADATIVAALVAGSGRERPAGAPPCVGELPALLAASPDVVVECAGQAALRAHGMAVLHAGIDLVPASIGLFADEEMQAAFRAAAAAGESRVRIPSGAVAGIDALFGARRLGLDEVRYRFVMSPAAWGHAIAPGEGAPGRTPEQAIVYAGPAREAARRFPRHANVTATIALAGIGLDRTQVELVVDAQATDNRHEIEASGAFGRLAVAVNGRRISPASPSSRLVAGSLLAAATTGAPHLE